MILYFVLILVFALVGCKIRIAGTFEDYAKKENTLSIKGIFVLCVFFSHMRSYVSFPTEGFMGELNNYGMTAIGLIGQLMVVMFLFYSGYGIIESVKRKGQEYLSGFLRKRFLTTYIRFAIMIVLFLIVDLLFGIVYPVKRYLLAFTGWTSIGNSNWFMFVIFMQYLFFLVSFLISGCDIKKGIIINLVFSIGLLTALFFLKESWWYNTLLCFNLGMFYSFYKEKIDLFLKKDSKYYITLFAFIVITFIVRSILSRTGAIKNLVYDLFAVLFALVVMLITMKFRIKNKILDFFGKHVFTIYMLQRLVFIIFKNIGLNNPYLFFVVSFIVTCIISYVFDVVFDLVMKKISLRRSNK